METAKVSAIIPFFRNAGELKECLSSLSACSYPSFEVIVIDNASEDEDIGWADGFSGRVRVFRESENKGFAGAVNRAIQELCAKDAELFWILNSDMVFDKDSMRTLAEVFERDGLTAIAGSKIRSYYDRRTLLGCGGVIDWGKLLTYHRGCSEADAGQYDTTEGVDYAPGCSLMLSKKAMDDMGCFDERFFMYFEDADICVRARKKGYKVFYVPASVVFHREASFKRGRGHSDLFCYYIARNTLRFFRAHGKITPFNFVKWFVINMKLNMRSPRKFAMFLKGIMDFFLGIDGKAHVG